MMTKGSLLRSVPIVKRFGRKFLSPKMGRKQQILNVKKLISLQHRVRAMKSHIQNSTNLFFWDIVIARSRIAITIHLT